MYDLSEPDICRDDEAAHSYKLGYNDGYADGWHDATDAIRNKKSEVRHPINSEGKENKIVTYCYECGTTVRNQKFCHGCGMRLMWA